MRIDGFEQVVTDAWRATLPGADPCRLLDFKLRRTARALQSWSMKTVGSVRSQLFMARELIAQFDKAQESRELSAAERELHKGVKLMSLGLASLSRTICRQRPRIRYLEEGDANTKFFQLQACHRNRKNVIPALQHDGTWFSADQAKADIIFEYYNGILGKPFSHEHSIRLDGLLPQLDLSTIDACFSEQEVWDTIKCLPGNRAPGLDGFTGLFYKVAWPIIKTDVMNAIHALWSLDSRSFNLLNDALLVLLRKHNAPTMLKDFRFQHIGFPRRWLDWTSILLSTASTRVLVNGRPGRRIAHARGQRQGDPISPMLFVIVMEVLNSLIKEADRRGVLTPLPGQVVNHRASPYADDLVVLLAPDPEDMSCLSQILHLFAEASGLVTNQEKCVASPICCDADVVPVVHAVFPFTVAPLPSRYLGIPLSLCHLLTSVGLMNNRSSMTSLLEF